MTHTPNPARRGRHQTAGSWLAASAVAVAVLLAACSLLPGHGTATLAGPPWTLVAIAGEPVDMSRSARLQFNSETGELTGSTGCNQLRGRYTADSPRLDITRVATTKMACLGAMDAERAFLDALAATQGYRIADGRLTLLDSADGVLATLEAGAS